jgi:hypothetical protein
VVREVREPPHLYLGKNPNVIATKLIHRVIHLTPSEIFHKIETATTEKESSKLL